MSSDTIISGPAATDIGNGKLDGGMRVRLAVMMFLEYAVWGAWMPILSATLFNRGVPGSAIGNIYAALWLACAITPFVGGQLADRLMPSQNFLGITHLLAAGAAFVMSVQTSTNGYLIWLFIWSLLFAPSLGITNAIALHHIDKARMDEANKEREFSVIRTAGSIGWIIAAFLLLGFVAITGADATGKTGPITEMRLAGILGIAMAVFSFTLPNTPPARGENVDPLAFRKAFSLFKTVPGFTIFMLVSFIAATEFQFFYVLSGPFLESGVFVQIPHNLVAPIKAISQAAEILALGVLLPIYLPKKGMRWCLLVGSFAWPLRYIIFAIGQPAWLVVASLALHGFGYAFVLVVQQLYVDRVSGPDIRSSAQNLLNLITLGFGNFLGSIFCGKVLAHYTDSATKTTNWVPVFILPAVLTIACAFAYLVTFRDPERHQR
jgi:nucleoside transporter